MTEQVDVLVIGAGIIGSSCAHQLSRRGKQVAVVDAGEAAEGSTGRSFASVRVQWPDSANIELSWRSIQAYRDFPRDFGVDVGYCPTGYLLLVPRQRWPLHLEAVRLQQAHGAPVEVLSLEQARQITPFVPDGLGGATWGPADGVVDPYLASTAFLRMAREHGAQVHLREPVTKVDRIADGWRVTTSHREFEAAHVVNAAGGWAGDIAALADMRLPVRHSRRNVYCTAAVPGGRTVPMTIDIGSGACVRTEGDRVLIMLSRPNEPVGYNVSVDWEWMESALTVVCERFPWMADIGLDRKACWAGTYEITPDHLPVVGEHPEAPGWVDACGFSGHGVMQAPEIGRLVAEEIVDGRAHSLDITPLRHERLHSPVTRLDMVF